MCRTVWYYLLSPRDRRAVDIGNKINEYMEEGKRKMMFEVGKEYRTINGEKAGIFYDGSVESDYIYDYPLKGYIEWKEGQRQDASWTSEGRYTGTGGYHGRDLIPQPMTVTHYAFAVWRGGSVDLFTRETLTEAKEVRALFRAQGSKVSEIVAVTLELQGDQK